MTIQNQRENDLKNQAALYGINLDLGANQQGYNQALQSGQFGNQAIAQNFGQGQSAAAFQNAAQQQQYGQNLQGGQFANQAQNQQYNQGLQSGQFANIAQAQNLGQQLYQRELPLNEISALMSGSQVQNPQFPQYSGVGVQPAPVIQGAQNQYNAGLQSYGMQNNANNAMFSGLMGLGGAAMGAPWFGPLMGMAKG